MYIYIYISEGPRYSTMIPKRPLVLVAPQNASNSPVLLQNLTDFDTSFFVDVISCCHVMSSGICTGHSTFLLKKPRIPVAPVVNESTGRIQYGLLFFDSAASSSLSESYSHRPTNRWAGTFRVWTPNLSALDSPGWHNHSLTTSNLSSYILPITLQHLHDTFISTYLHFHCIPHSYNSEVRCQYTPLQSNIHVSKGHCSSAITPWFWTISLLRSNYSSRSSQKERNSNSLVTTVDTRLLLLLRGGKPNNSRCICPLTFLSEYLTRLTEAVYGVWIPILGALPRTNIHHRPPTCLCGGPLRECLCAENFTVTLLLRNTRMCS